MSLSSDLTPGEMAARSGLSVSALHFYEREGLIRSWRTPGNQRRYDRSTLRRLSLIRAAQNLGVPLKEIREKLAPLPHDRPVRKSDWAMVAKDWNEALSQRIERLERLRTSLDGCIGCGCLSMEKCPLYNEDDHLRLRGTGAILIDEKY